MKITWAFCSGIYFLAVLNGAGQTAGSILWEFNLGSYWSSPALGTDGTIYVGGSNKLYAINPNGTVKWDFPLDSPGHPLLGPDGTIYVGELGQSFRRFVALTPAGANKWEFSPGGGNMRAAVAGDGTIYLAANNVLHALRPNGSRLWSFTNGFGSICTRASFGTPAIGNDGTVYVPSRHPDNRLFAFSPNGTTNWTFSTGRQTYYFAGECGMEPVGEAWSAPAIGSDGTVYIGACLGDSDASNRQSTLYAINPAGTTNWLCHIGGNTMGEDHAPAIGTDGTIYINSYVALFGGAVGPPTNKLVAVSATGSNTWEFVIPGFSAGGSPTVTADGKVLIGSTGGKLFTVGVDGTNANFFPVTGLVSQATVTPDGTIYVVTWSGTPGSGTLYALAGNAGPANTPWPMFRRDSRQSGRVPLPAATRPTLLSLRRIAPTDFELSYQGERLRDYHIEASSNLFQWRVANTLFSSGERIQFRDAAADDSAPRFYRLVSP